MAEVSSQRVNSDKTANEVPGSEETFKSAEAGGHLDRDFAIQHAKEVDIQRIEYVVQKERLEGKLKHSEDAAIGGEIQQHAIVEADCVNEDEVQQGNGKCGSSQDVLKTAEPVLDTEVKEMKAVEAKGLDISLVSEENRFANHEDSISYEISMIAG
ncbi:hypothetical protein Ancab_005505 [Ancistrocladus abbreviatus]